MIKRILHKLGYAPLADVDRAYRTGHHDGSTVQRRHYTRLLEIQTQRHAMMKRELEHIRKLLVDNAALSPAKRFYINRGDLTAMKRELDDMDEMLTDHAAAHPPQGD